MKSKKVKKPKTIVIEDYSSMVIEPSYNRRKSKINYGETIGKRDCFALNYVMRSKNVSYFNSVLHRTIIYFINRENLAKEELRTILGATLNEISSIYDEAKFNKSINFKLIYDICAAIDISLAELIGKMEEEFKNS